MSFNVRAPAVAGRFYPAEPDVLEQQVAKFLAPHPPMPSEPAAVISPHAGYAFSGALTGQALAATRSNTPDVIVILSPSHRHAFDGLALPSHEVFSVPGGELPVAEGLKTDLIREGLAKIEDAAHAHEHGVETQLPFLRALHPGVPILPVVIGHASAEEVARLVDHVAQAAARPLFVLSSDLSHFLTKEDAEQKDANTARRIETGQTGLSGAEACGARAIAGYFASHHAQGNRCIRLGMANSAATTGDVTRTVGYGAWSVMPALGECLDEAQRQRLLKLARQVLTSRVNRGKSPYIDTGTFPSWMQTHAACFVTLEQKGRLRGCIGSLRAHRPLVEDVAINVQKAAFEDRRFRPLRAEELEHTTLKIALLSPTHPMSFADQADLESQLVPHRDGLILRDAGHAGTFLPMVWDKLTGPHEFVQALKQKAGLPPEHWSDTLTVDLFHAETFAEG